MKTLFIMSFLSLNLQASVVPDKGYVEDENHRPPPTDMSLRQAEEERPMLNREDWANTREKRAQPAKNSRQSLEEFKETELAE